MADIAHVIRSTTNPSTAPAREGMHFINTVTKQTWLSVGTANVADWVLVDGTTLWGSITGTLSNQTDLQNALNSKENTGVASGLISGHEAAGDPHPQYATDSALSSGLSGKENVGVAAGLISAHESALNPHPNYATDTDLSSHTGNTSNPHSVTKAQVGLGNVDDTSDANKPISTATQTALNLKADITYVDTVVTSVYKFISNYNATTNTPNITTAPNSIKTGHSYIVNVAGTFFGEAVEVGDNIIAKQDNPSLASHWSVVQTNLTAASIKTQYESNADTNAFTDAEQSKLAGIEAGAEVNNISDIDAADLLGTNDTTLHYHDSDRNRANHTGSQAISTVTGLQTALDNKLGTGLASGNFLVGNGSGIATPQTLSGDVTATDAGVVTIANSAVTNAKVAAGIDAVKIADGTISNTEFQYLNGVNENIQTQFNRIDSTGVSTGGEVTYNSPTTFNVAAGTGHIVDHSTNPPTKTLVSWNAQTNVTATLIGSGQFTRIEVDSLGVISQTNTVQTDSDRLNKIQLGILVHDNLTTITNVFSAPNPDYSIIGSLRDLAEGIGTIIKSGSVYSANGTNLNINRSAGTAFVWGRAYGSNKNFPSNIATGAGTALQFYRVYQSGANTFTYSTLQTAVDPANYNTGNALVSVPVNKWQIQYIYFYPEHGNTYIVYGQNVYNSQAEAVAAIGRETTVHDARFARASLRAFLVLKQGATALNDVGQAVFYSGGKFGSVSPTGSAISSVTDLQSAYNASANPEIVLDSAKAAPAITIRDSATPVSGNLFEIQNNAGSSTYFSVSPTAVKIGAIANAETTINSKLGETFETVNKNLKQYNYTLNYTGETLTSIVYSNGVTKTLNYSSGLVTSIVLSGSTPAGINLTKTLTYSSGVLTSIAYS